MKNNKVNAVLSENMAKKFEEITKKTGWSDKALISAAIGELYIKFSKDWKKTVLEIMERGIEK